VDHGKVAVLGAFGREQAALDLSEALSAWGLFDPAADTVLWLATGPRPYLRLTWRGLSRLRRLARWLHAALEVPLSARPVTVEGLERPAVVFEWPESHLPSEVTARLAAAMGFWWTVDDPVRAESMATRLAKSEEPGLVLATGEVEEPVNQPSQPAAGPDSGRSASSEADHPPVPEASPRDTLGQRPTMPVSRLVPAQVVSAGPVRPVWTRSALAPQSSGSRTPKIPRVTAPPTGRGWG
jgi:hypothetical protein